MKSFSILMLVLLLTAVVAAQPAVRTEATSNQYKSYIAATTGDTLNRSGSTTYGAALVGLVINTAVAQDTFIVKDGYRTIGTIIIGATAPAYPIYIPYNVHVDTLAYVQKKTSNVTLIWRSRW
jgi:hypothetical protein